ncbi:MAG: PEP-CTERM sorting domain-containing protein [Planctomycetales bacterium]|nr:PEP-CTERM sorting domain-containing protein [Planctomycetales bacterium]
MNSSLSVKTFLCFAALATMLSSVAQAVPYASGIDTTSNPGTVNFVLNEDADSVVIKRTGDTDLVLGALTKGPQSFPVGAASAWDIEVSKTTAVGWTQTSSDFDQESAFFSPKGVAINNNPASPYFGAIYVSEGASGAVNKDPGGGSVLIRTTLDGLFIMAADQSDTLYAGTGGQAEFGAVGLGGDWSLSSNTPFKISIAPDDSVYVAGWGDAHAGVWRAPANLDETAAWPTVLANDNQQSSGLADNHGSVDAVWIEGTGASTVLYTMDEEWPDPASGGTFPDGRGDILRYDIGTATDYQGLPTVQVDDDTPSPDGVILNGLMDFVRDADGSWWIAQYRSDDSKSVPALSHWADGGTAPLWTSGKNAREEGDFNWDSDVDGFDFLTWQRNTGSSNTVWFGDANLDTFVDNADEVLWEGNFGNHIPGEVVLDGGYGDVAIHDDLDLLAVGARNGQGVYIIDISNPAAPELVSTVPHASRVTDVAFDAAGNVYVTSNISETLRIFSPGGAYTSTTSSNGTFSRTALGPLAGSTIPEPSSLAIALLGMIGLSGRRFSSRRSRS